MKIDIVIPTYHRNKKLIKAIESIKIAKKNYDIKLYLFFSDQKDFETININDKWVFCYLIDNYNVPLFWNSFLGNMIADCLLYLNDDITLYPDAIDKVIYNMQKYYPDYDGVLGFNQVNIPNNQVLPSAFGAIGKKFADRYPNRAIFCWDYYRFYADKELYLYATKINKFRFCEDIKLNHYHPAFYPDLIDDTHIKVRQYLQKDRQTFNIRQQKGYLWGANFYLLNQRS